MRGIQWLQSHQIQPSRFRNTKKAESPLQPVTGTMPPSKCCPWLAHSRSFDFLTVTLRSSCTAFCDNRFVLPENFGLKQTDLILFRFKYVIYCFLRVCVCVCVCVCVFFLMLPQSSCCLCPALSSWKCSLKNTTGFYDIIIPIPLLTRAPVWLSEGTERSGVRFTPDISETDGPICKTQTGINSPATKLPCLPY